jgi:hypothetical protein
VANTQLRAKEISTDGRNDAVHFAQLQPNERHEGFTGHNLHGRQNDTNIKVMVRSPVGGRFYDNLF